MGHIFGLLHTFRGVELDLLPSTSSVTAKANICEQPCSNQGDDAVWFQMFMILVFFKKKTSWKQQIGFWWFLCWHSTNTWKYWMQRSYTGNKTIYFENWIFYLFFFLFSKMAIYSVMKVEQNHFVLIVKVKLGAKQLIGMWWVTPMTNVYYQKYVSFSFFF